MDKCNTCDAHLLALVTGFAAGMLLIEILLEAVFALPNLPHTVSLWNAVGQFVVCAFLPACIVRFQNLARRCSRASRQKSISLEADVPPAFDVEKAAKELHNHVDGSRWYEIMMAWLPYAVIGALQFSSSVFANHAVLYVDFTVKVVFKASKLLPTMVLATMMKNHRPFSKVEYMAALMICGGTALFSHGGTKHDRDGKPVGSILIGASLLACSVLAEGYVANLQQVVLKKCSSDDVMFRTNILGAVGGFILLLLSGNAQDLIQYAAIHPSVVPLLVGSHLCLGISVWCYQAHQTSWQCLCD
eukprot:TRINITY_DN14327_c0_g2_i1.p1 TRINITY_DN14327_c0_g2~~TRINITY_DN14327_c0_g2_i1.p1  ORF type:complete len:302 (-),score=31.09 TRINITY_DN14327_c0_g2_i1:209-1114(-)